VLKLQTLNRVFSFTKNANLSPPLNSAHHLEATKRMRIAVLNSHPIQYFAPLYRYLNATPDLEITALYLSDFSIREARDVGFGRDVRWDVDLLSGYRSVFLGKGAGTREPNGFWSLIAPSVWSELRSGRYDVLWLHGHNYAANFIALMAAKANGMSVMMRGETHLGLARKRLKTALRRPLLGTLYGQCDRLLAIGSANASFYQAMGVPHQKIFLVPYTVDNQRFRGKARLSREQKVEIRNRYGLGLDQPAVLYAAKFTPRKRPGDLLEATRRLKLETGRPFTLAMVGSGELEGDLRAFCAEHALDNVVFPGFVNQSQLPELYGACDIFVLPSEHEPWGLAVNEAMCAGLPVVVAQEVGCVSDLVRNGINGYTPAVGDIKSLATVLRWLIEDETLRQRQGEASAARISQWGFEQCLQGIRAALIDLDSKTPLAS
jgi:glycosyltransferase involved in cell wall biosynthesis